MLNTVRRWLSYFCIYLSIPFQILQSQESEAIWKKWGGNELKPGLSKRNTSVEIAEEVSSKKDMEPGTEPHRSRRTLIGPARGGRSWTGKVDGEVEPQGRQGKGGRGQGVEQGSAWGRGMGGGKEVLWLSGKVGNQGGGKHGGEGEAGLSKAECTGQKWCKRCRFTSSLYLASLKQLEISRT